MVSSSRLGHTNSPWEVKISKAKKLTQKSKTAMKNYCSIQLPSKLKKWDPQCYANQFYADDI